MSQTTYQVILSTDGKHTVIVTSDDVAETKGAIDWARATYDRLVKRYGRKGEQRQRHGEAEDVPICVVHQVPMERVEGRYGPFWSCHERAEDGSWCAYRPNGQ